MRLCVIPARGGSKRVPRKNIRLFRGKPMITWSIEAAKSSQCFDLIVVSTDDSEIAKVSRSWGATVPFMRPAHLADDYEGTAPVVLHAIEWSIANKVEPKEVCCLYATAPFVSGVDIRRGMKMLAGAGPDQFVFTATNYASPIQRALLIDNESKISQMREPDSYEKRSQDLVRTYHDAAQFYWGRPRAWRGMKNMFNGSKALILPRWRVQDIDTEEDWRQAELMHRASDLVSEST